MHAPVHEVAVWSWTSCSMEGTLKLNIRSDDVFCVLVLHSMTGPPAVAILVWRSITLRGGKSSGVGVLSRILKCLHLRILHTNIWTFYFFT